MQTAVAKAELRVPDLLNPDINPFPKSFPLPSYLNPYADKDVDVFPIMPYTPYVPNIKGFMARHMLEKAREEGRLKGIHTLVEASSGNTAAALALLAPYYGVRRMVAVVKRDTAPGKLEELRAYGADIVYPESKDISTIDQAKRLATQSGWFNLNQYGSFANPEAHRLFTAPHVVVQTERKISLFVTGLGTTGTAIGVKRYFTAKGINASVVGVFLEPNAAVPGVRTREELKQIDLPWEASLDGLVEMSTEESYWWSLQLRRAGRFTGPSSGLALAGLYKFLGMQGRNLDQFRNKERRIVAAFICGDTHFPYTEKYSARLGPDSFEPIHPDKVSC